MKTFNTVVDIVAAIALVILLIMAGTGNHARNVTAANQKLCIRSMYAWELSDYDNYTEEQANQMYAQDNVNVRNDCMDYLRK